MSTLEEVRARIEDDINRTDVTARVLKEIKSAVLHYGRMPFWFNEARSTLTASSSASFLTVPSDYLSTVELYINIGTFPSKLIPATLDRVVGGRQSNGSQPTHYCYYGDRFELNCEVNQEYTFPLYYVKEMATLSASTDSSVWTYQGEDLIVARAEKVLYRDVLKDMQKFQLAKDAEREAKSSLLGFRDQKIGSGHAEPWGY